MEIVLMIVCVLLIIFVLLQSSKAEGAAQIFTGGNTDLFKNRKERGSELVISRITLGLGVLFLILSVIISTM